MSESVSGALAASLEAIKAGRPVLVIDDEDRENEGDVVLAAARVTPDWMAWTVRETTGIVCAPMASSVAARLRLPQMVSANQDPRNTAYTVTVDARIGVTTGVSAADRVHTMRVLADPLARADDLVRPGHILPLRARDGGLAQRRGHTEAAVGLCELAGETPVAAIAELVADDGSMMRAPQIRDLGMRMQLPVLTIAELAGYWLEQPRIAPPAPRVTRVVETSLGTRHGQFRAIGYWDCDTGAEHTVLVAEGATAIPVVRVHSECLTGEAFHSERCECGPQLDASLEAVAASGGAVVYLRGHEGRGIGLLKKLAAYRLQDNGLDTLQANLALGEPADAREYGAAAAILADLGFTSVALMTNNPAKIEGLESAGITVARRIPIMVGATPANVRYLQTKRARLGHLLPPGRFDEPDGIAIQE
jgi:3,4-dihydroxy 2-butanone 4-phosphate synthase / GTP cyclohydrolase II